MRTPAQRGRIGNWLRDERVARGWTQVEAVKNLTRAGVPVSQSVYSEWESGSRIPNDRNLGRLEEFFGPAPESPAEATPAGLSDLVARLDRQADLMTEMLGVRRSGEEELAELRGRIAALEVQVASLVAASQSLRPGPDGRASSTRAAPRGSEG